MNPIEAEPIHVLVQYAEPVLAVGLIAALRTVSGLAVSGPVTEPASPASDAVDIVVTDYRGGLDLLARQRAGTAALLARARVMVVAAQHRENEVRVALEQGVHGYLLLGCSLQELGQAAQALARGSRFLSMEVAQRMADSLTREALTARESDVLRLLALGRCNKTIARQLDIAIGTVKTHVKAIMCKLDAASRTHAVTIASSRGLVDAVPADLPLPGATFGRMAPAMDVPRYA